MTKDSFNKKNIDSATYAFMRELLEELLQEDPVMAENLRDWIKQKWVRITSSGDIGGSCGTSKKQSNPARCLPQAKAKSMTQSQRAATARKKKEGGIYSAVLCAAVHACLHVDYICACSMLFHACV